MSENEHRERVVTGEPVSEQEENFSWNLRPTSLAEYVGQRKLVEKLDIALKAAKTRKEPLDHTLFYGPPGLGKTTLAHIIAGEMGSKLITTSGPSIERQGDLMGILTNLQYGDVLFIDEVHRLPRVVEEFLYPAMEDFKVDFLVDKGVFAKTINVPLKRFTLVGATTRAGFLSSPFRSRFGIFNHVEFYPVEDLIKIIRRSAGIIEIEVEEGAFAIMAQRSRGTPRIANRLLKRVRDYATVRNNGRITEQAALEALDIEGIDSRGLDEQDRKFLNTIIDFYDGGPVGIEALAATLNEESDTLHDMIEPYLLQIGFLKRTRKGRVAGVRAYEHLDKKMPGTVQQEFWK